MKASVILALLFLGASGHTSMVMAQSSGTFTATGNMTTARAEHTATVLLDGRVLIAGGFVDGLNFSPTNSAELYDPVTGQWSGTGSMISPRAEHLAVRLTNGKVLVAGGSTGYLAFVTSAEIYDPDTGTWSAAGGFSVARANASATLLADGKVLVAGGGRSVWASDTSQGAELYDPGTGAWSPAGTMNDARAYHTATLLSDGRVLVAGGGVDSFRSAELYDPATGKWTPTGSLNSERLLHAATLLPNGKVLVAGGWTPGDDYAYGMDSAELYDPATGEWSTTGSPIAPRVIYPVTLLPNGKVLVVGGYAPGYDTLSSAELYDPSTGTFGSIGNMTARRSEHTATFLNDGRVLITGGISELATEGPPNLASAELYNPPVLVPAPVLLSLSGDGKGQGAIQHAGTYRIASADDPAVAGEYLSIYLTGLADGSVIPPQVAIGGRLAEITFFGNVSGYPGLDVINVRMPSGVVPGPAVSVQLTYLSRPSNAVTVGVR